MITPDLPAPPSATQPPAAPEGGAPKTEITRATLQSHEPPTGWWGRKFRVIEAWLSELSTRSNFWHRVFAWKFLPLAYQSGIKLGKQKGDVYEAFMPFKAFNKNWYEAMAGAALLANSEVAGGMYIFEKLGGDYTVVCKELHYKFRRPCHGPAIYRVKPREDIDEQRKTALEFNVTTDLEIVQAITKKGEKERKVGECVATFHVAAKALFRQRRAKEKDKRARLAKD